MKSDAQRPTPLAFDPASADAALEDAFFTRCLEAQAGATGEASETTFVGRRFQPRNWEGLRRNAVAVAAGLGAAAVIGLALWQGQRPGQPRAHAQEPTPPVASTKTLPPKPAPAPAAAEPTTIAQVLVDERPTSEAAERCRHAGGRHLRNTREVCLLALAAHPQAPDLIATLARFELADGQTARALELAGQAIGLSPGLAEAYYVIGAAQHESGRTSDAKAAYQKYLELAPDGRYAAELRAVVSDM